MANLWKSNNGAVTVMVTLLLIPSILFCGTAVDLARIYTTRSMVQNANQLAANSALARYNALLKDLYAVYGYMQDDPALAEMLNDYIEVSVLGKNPGKTDDLGTFRSFYGSDEITTIPSCERNLSETEVLRQQILEYMKFRGPVILIQQLFDGLNGIGGMEKLSDDMEVIEAKREIDDALCGIFDQYKELHEAIRLADLCKQIKGIHDAGISGYPFNQLTIKFNEIRSQFIKMDDSRTNYKEAIMNADNASSPLERTEYIYIATENIGKYYSAMQDIKQRAEKARGYADDAKQVALDFKEYFDKVETISDSIDQQKEKIKNDIENLRIRLENRECSDDIYDAFMVPSAPGEKCLMDQYGDLLEIEIKPMATAYKDEGYSYIDDRVIPMLEDVRYRDFTKAMTSTNSLTVEQLKNLASNDDFDIESVGNLASYFADFINLNYNMPDPYNKFGDIYFGAEQQKFFNDLEELVKGNGSKDFYDLITGERMTGTDDTETEQKRQIEELKNKTDELDENTPSAGAKKITDPGWSKKNEELNLLALPKNIISVFSDPLQALSDAIDYTLILTYGMTMFSNYVTTKPHEPDKDIEYHKSITGITIDPKVNYFYESEWEYLFNGENDANKNLGAIKALIFSVRLIANYISVWKVDEITAIVNSVKAIPLPFGLNIVLGELVRAGFVAAESGVDVARLRKGYRVEILKTNETWLCKPSTMIKLPGNEDDDKGLTYTNYLLVFFIAKPLLTSDVNTAANVVVARTGDLIEWNTVNYQEGVNADEDAMTAALDKPGRFKLENAATCIGLTTTVLKKTIFLSMPFSQIGINGIIPPKTIPITLIDKRGY